eukprot:TRINITY_DN92314_c0_g1_i1.p1 TRINITY_DN92314_c0_g1~~TRINITY_DN92314_c0_g1_i1.p1  ORF type:complete len:689 (-),score=144.12 TRINITY_DN92314_c0_g1_i1:40-2106(-)
MTDWRVSRPMADWEVSGSSAAWRQQLLPCAVGTEAGHSRPCAPAVVAGGNGCCFVAGAPPEWSSIQGPSQLVRWDVSRFWRASAPHISRQTDGADVEALSRFLFGAAAASTLCGLRLMRKWRGQSKRLYARQLPGLARQATTVAQQVPVSVPTDEPTQAAVEAEQNAPLQRDVERDAWLFVSMGEVEPVAPQAAAVEELLAWARTQEAVQMSASLAVAESGRLIVQEAIPQGTPLVVLKPDLFLGEQPVVFNTEDNASGQAVVIDVDTDPAGGSGEAFVPVSSLPAAEAECRRLLEEAGEPELWPLRLGLRILKEAADSKSPWFAYLASLDPRPPAPLMWSLDQAAELQYLPVMTSLKAQLRRLSEFYSQQLQGNFKFGSEASRVGLVTAVACAAGRATSIPNTDCDHTLLPVIDLVGPPETSTEATAVFDERVLPNCTLEFGEEGATLRAARDLQPEEVLTRDVALSPDEVLMRYGVPTSGIVEDEVVIAACIGAGSARNWQLRAIERLCGPTEPGPMKGDVIVRSCVRRSDTLSGAIGGELFVCARVLSCKKKEELYGDEGEWAGAEVAKQRGLSGLRKEVRLKCLGVLTKTVEDCASAFMSSATYDREILKSLRNANRSRATAYRLQKKRILEDVLALLHNMTEKEGGKVKKSSSMDASKDGGESKSPAAGGRRKRASSSRKGFS